MEVDATEVVTSTSPRLLLLLFAIAIAPGCSCDEVCPQECPQTCADDGSCPLGPEGEPGVEPDGEPGAEPAPSPEGECEEDADCADGVCFGGACSECNGGGDCPAGETCAQGRCTADDECAAANQCGRGGDCCPSDGVCLDSVCRPPCETTRCGPDLVQCCDAGDLCYGGGCAAVGDPCLSAADCGPNEICEIDLGICLDEAVVGSCEYIPPPGVFEPQVECRWTPEEGVLNPVQNDVVMAPVVGNLTDDNEDGATDRLDTPELVFISYDLEDTGCCNIAGTIRIVDGRCAGDGMRTIASIDTPLIDNSGGLALGDLDGDGVMEIVAMTIVDDQPQGTAAFKRVTADGSEWELLWHNPTYPTWNVHTRGATQPALTDLDGNGAVEVIVGNVVLTGLNGALLWDGLATVGPTAGIGNNAFLGPVSSAVDLDGDGSLEVLAGNTIYNADGSERVTFTFETEGSGCGGSLPCDGYTAAANFDDDPDGEVVIVRQGEVFILEHTGELIRRIPIPVDDCPNNESGPPTIADFDGDGAAEIGTAAGDFYVVIDPACTAADAACQDDGILWAVPNEDCTSRVTASSVFDFEGDGAAEVIYADEDTFRIFRGSDGEILFNDETHGSHTRLEMAVIADVDNDGNAEVIIPENSSRNGTPGVEIWGDALDNWVFTRRIWNQHSYHVTHVTEEGTILGATQNWNVPGLNHFRQNSQGEGIFLAPDLVIDDVRSICLPTLDLTLRFFVKNIGSRIVGPGVSVAIYQLADGERGLLATAETSVVLVPGQSEEMEIEIDASGLGQAFDIEVVADDDGTGAGQNNECDEVNNAKERSVRCIQDG